jgi:hypothetical protein
MYACIWSNTTQASLCYNVLITIKLHVSAFFHRAIIGLICEMLSIMYAQTQSVIRDLVWDAIKFV